MSGRTVTVRLAFPPEPLPPPPGYAFAQVIGDEALTMTAPPGAMLLLAATDAERLEAAGHLHRATLTLPGHRRELDLTIPDTPAQEPPPVQVILRPGAIQVAPPSVEVTNLIEAPRRTVTLDRDTQGRLTGATIDDATTPG